jgi:hypothetical protein
MGSATAVASVVAGFGLISLVLRDIFRALVRPLPHGTVGWLVERGVWRLLHAASPSSLPLGGSLIFVGTVAAWLALLALGGGFLYWPMLPDGFRVVAELRQAGAASFLDALYLSLVTLATLGFGDLTPTAGWLQIVVPLQSVVGFVLLTAAISWLISIFPAVRGQWAVALRIHIGLEASAGLPSESWMDALTPELVGLRIDLDQFPVAYYFQARDRRSALPLALAELHARIASQDGSGEAVRRLRLAIDDLATYIGDRFLDGARETDDVLRRYAEDHAHEARTEAG